MKNNNQFSSFLFKNKLPAVAGKLLLRAGGSSSCYARAGRAAFSDQPFTASKNKGKYVSLSVPFFKNPKSSVILSSLIKETGPFTAAAETGSLSRETAAAADRQKVQRSWPLIKLNKLIYLKSKGSQKPNLNIISYNFPGSEKSTCDINKLLSYNVYKLLFYFFKSMYCLISKPVFTITSNKINIQLFYFICLPKLFFNPNKLGASSYAAAAFKSNNFSVDGSDSEFFEDNLRTVNDPSSRAADPRSLEELPCAQTIAASLLKQGPRGSNLDLAAAASLIRLPADTLAGSKSSWPASFRPVQDDIENSSSGKLCLQLPKTAPAKLQLQLIEKPFSSSKDSQGADTDKGTLVPDTADALFLSTWQQPVQNTNYLRMKNFNSKDFPQGEKIKLIKLASAASVASAATEAPSGFFKKIYPYKFKLICTILSKIFNKPVEFELIRLHQPYYDSNILANFLALIINKKNIGAAIQRLFNSNIIKSGPLGKNSNLASVEDSSYSQNDPKKENLVLSHRLRQPLTAAACIRQLLPDGSCWPGAATINLKQNKDSKIASLANISGLNIKINGRLMREPIIPRLTTKNFDKGFTAKGKINYSDVAKFTHKNRKGAFTITVKSGQKFF